jgi:DNA-binding LacI/PurR family transcriptional regulator
MKLHSQVRAGLERAITTGRYQPQDVLPPIPVMAAERKCSVATIRRALADLAQAGVVRSIQKRGTVVLRKPVRGHVALLLSPDAQFNALFQQPVYRALLGAGYDVTMGSYDVGAAECRAWCARVRAEAYPPQALIVFSGQALQRATGAVQRAYDDLFARQIWLDLDLHPSSIPQTVSAVLLDYRREARVLVEHLAELGHRRVAICAGPAPGQRTYQAALADQFRDLWEVRGGECHPYHAREGIARIVHLVRQEGATAIVEQHDLGAIKALYQLQSIGVRVPGEVSLLGRHDTTWSRDVVPALSTVSPNPPALARQVVAAVRDRLHDRAPRLYEGAPYIVARDSTARPRG